MTSPASRSRRAARAPRGRAAAAAGAEPARTRRAVVVASLRWQAATLILATIIVYANSVSNPFVLDDEAAIVQNPQVRTPASLADVLVPDAESPVAGRPLANATFVANHAWHGLDVRGYHAVNIGLHAACAVLVLLLLRRTFGLPVAAPAGAHGAVIAFGAAVLWAVHPLNSEVVDYISQRTESLMAMCYLATLFAAVRAAQPATTAARLRWETASVLACAAGMASKESMVTAPLMVALYDRVFLFTSWRSAAAHRSRLYGGLGATWIVLALAIVGGPRSQIAGWSSGVSAWTYLLNQARVIPEYLRLAVWPDSLVVFYGWPQPLAFGDVAPGFLALAVAVALTVFTLWKGLTGGAPRDRYYAAAGFAAAWYFLTLAPTSSLVPIATEVAAERRMYLPSIALAAAAMLGIVAAAVAWRRRDSPEVVMNRRVALTSLAVTVAIAVALSAVTIRRNAEYSSPLTLAQTVVDRRPTGVAHHMLAEQLVLAGRGAEALSHLRQAVALGNSRAGYLLGRMLAERGDHDEAIAVLETFLHTASPPEPLVPAWLEPPITEIVPARYALGRVRGERGEWDRAIVQARLILDAVPSHVGANGLLGDAFFARQDWETAAAHYRIYLERQPADAAALINYGVTRVAVGDLDDAIRSFQTATRIDPSNARARHLLELAQDDRARLHK